MEPFTMDRNFKQLNVIDNFLSLIWTERYYGDSEVELVVPASPEIIATLAEGTFLGIEESDEVMILETANVENDKLKVTGISLLSWLDNRFVRTSAAHEDRYWYLSGGTAGWTLWAIVYYMCCLGSPYLDGSIPIGIDNPQQLVIPGLGLLDYDKSGDNISVGVPYGPVYKALREIATTYEIGMQIVLEAVSDDPASLFALGFRSYKGLNRTSTQTENTSVRFSPQMDSLTGIKELRSIAALKTLVYAFAPQNPDGLATTPGSSSLSGGQYTGFDLRALLVFADDISTDMVGGDANNLVNILNSRAYDALTNNHFIKTVDGEIVPTNQYKYGVDYRLGDVIEVQGLSGIVQTSRITEYIRAQDESGEKAYPTVAMLS